MASAHSYRPFATVLAAVALYSLMDALMKGASLAVGTYSALLLRGGCGLLLTLPLYLATGHRWPGPAALKVHLKRGLVAAAMAFTFFWGITQMPLAEAIALSFIAPLIALYLAAVLLGERVEPRAIGASLAGLAGVAVIVAGQLHGGTGARQGALGIASILTSALLYAWNLVLQRQQALLARPLEVATFQNAIMALALAVFAPWFLTIPAAPTAWGWIAGSAVLATGALMLFSWAYARAEAQALVPLEYSAFLWALLFGWLFFGEGLRAATLLGVALIVAACWIAAPRRRPEPSVA
ncbi:MAG: EamA family transporter [Sphingomonadales bacterium 12-68-11]|nr:MAG: EamA family transporter [Sphingomonadales bacterium 12-68-11]